MLVWFFHAHSVLLFSSTKEPKGSYLSFGSVKQIRCAVAVMEHFDLRRFISPSRIMISLSLNRVIPSLRPGYFSLNRVITIVTEQGDPFFTTRLFLFEQGDHHGLWRGWSIWAEWSCFCFSKRINWVSTVKFLHQKHHRKRLLSNVIVKD